MLRKALLLSLLLHVLLLAALAHTISLPPVPKLPFMLELRVAPAEAPGPAVAADAPHNATPVSHPASKPVVSRVVPAPQRVAPSTANPQAAAKAAVVPAPPGAAPAAVAGVAAAPAAVPAGAAGNVQAGGAKAATGGGESRGPRLLSAPRPDYPPLARQLGEEGVVHIRLTINERGQVSAVTPLRSSGFSRLDKAALAAVWQWRYEPQLDAGKAVVGEKEVTVRFDLHESE